MAAAGNFRALLALVALLSLSLGVLGDCVSYGVDYANGGAYYIDGSSNQYFSFITVFQGKSCLFVFLLGAPFVRSDGWRATAEGNG